MYLCKHPLRIFCCLYYGLEYKFYVLILWPYYLFRIQILFGFENYANEFLILNSILCAYISY